RSWSRPTELDGPVKTVYAEPAQRGDRADADGEPWKGVRVGRAKLIARIGVAACLASMLFTLAAVNAPGQMFRSSRVAGQLKTATELTIRGDFEDAAPYYQQVQARFNELTEEDKRNFQHWLGRNNDGLQARQQATQMLNLADQLLAANRPQEANERLQTVF